MYISRQDEISTRYLWTREIFRQKRISTSYPRQDIISTRFLVLPLLCSTGCTYQEKMKFQLDIFGQDTKISLDEI